MAKEDPITTTVDPTATTNGRLTTSDGVDVVRARSALSRCIRRYELAQPMLPLQAREPPAALSFAVGLSLFVLRLRVRIEPRVRTPDGRAPLLTLNPEIPYSRRDRLLARRRFVQRRNTTNFVTARPTSRRRVGIDDSTHRARGTGAAHSTSVESSSRQSPLSWQDPARSSTAQSTQDEQDTAAWRCWTPETETAAARRRRNKNRAQALCRLEVVRRRRQVFQSQQPAWMSNNLHRVG